MSAVLSVVLSSVAESLSWGIHEILFFTITSYREVMTDNSICVALSHTLPHLHLTITLNMQGARPGSAIYSRTVYRGFLAPPSNLGSQCQFQSSKPTGSNHYIKPKKFLNDICPQHVIKWLFKRKLFLINFFKILQDLCIKAHWRFLPSPRISCKIHPGPQSNSLGICCNIILASCMILGNI